MAFPLTMCESTLNSATPLRPQTILTAHVLVKLVLTAVTMALTVLAGKRYYPINMQVPIFGFTIALLISTWSILSIGFVIASIVPTARFAQPIGAAILYPMVGLCGLFVPLQSLPPALQAVSRVLPLTYAVSLLQGIWKGEPWWAHKGDVVALVGKPPEEMTDAEYLGTLNVLGWDQPTIEDM